MFNQMIRVAVCASIIGFSTAPMAADKAVDAARQFRQAHELEILGDFRELLAMPNVATNIDDMMSNAVWISAYLAKRGFTKIGRASCRERV